MGYYHDNIFSGLSIRRSSNLFTVGESASMTCSSDLDVISIEWLYNLQAVVTSTASELQLLFNPVNDSIRGQEYTCRITASYGIQEQIVQPFVQSKCFCISTLHKSNIANFYSSH